jgi:hypothetical protein
MGGENYSVIHTGYSIEVFKQEIQDKFHWPLCKMKVNYKMSY